ncbi:MAG: TonB-dependent receptor [Bacteroidales bacterium]|jgi:hypothetical protein
MNNKFVFYCFFIIKITISIVVFGNFRNDHKAELSQYRGSISGIVRDSITKDSIEYASIILYEQGDSSLITGSITDSNGKFIISEVPAGIYNLVVKYLGYEPEIISHIQIPDKQEKIELGAINLKPLITDLEAVEIVANKQLVTYKLDKKIINVSSHVQATSGTAVDILRTIPSVEVDIEGNVRLHGSSNFIVLIDGKPSVLSGSDVLQQTPASILRNIEIITNPAAKYDPDGESGIVNLITKKENKVGTSALLSISGTTWNKYSSDLYWNHNADKFSIVQSLTYNNYPVEYNGLIYREDYRADTNIIVSDIKNITTRKGYNLRTDLDYSIFKNNTITFINNIRFFEFERVLSTSYNDSNTDYYEIDDIHRNQVKVYEFALRNKHNFTEKGHSITFFGNYIKNPGKRFNSQTTYGTKNISQNDSLYSINKTHVDNFMDRFRVQVDYTGPLGEEGEIEMGYSAEFNHSNIDYTFSNYDLNSGIWNNNDSISNSYGFIRNIHSIYSTAASKFLKFEFKVGLRMEYTDRNLDQTKKDSSYRYEKISFFPGIHIGYRIKDHHRIQLSYSRRITRPDDFQLNPFPYYIDKNIAFWGNHSLNPSFTDSYELSYFYQNEAFTFSIETYYKHAQDRVQQLRMLDDHETLIVLITNIDYTNTIGTELNISIKPAGWLQIFPGANVYYNSMKGWAFDTYIRKYDMALNLYLNAIWNITKKTSLQVYGFYNSPREWFQGLQRENYAINFGLKQSLLKNRLSLTLTGNDIFKTGRLSGTSEGNYFFTDEEFVPEAPIISLSISYSFNSFKSFRKNRESDNFEDMGGGIL